ncbi:hypothetical protein [Microbulbifer taiwanensis]|uniref:hypothetical protein n=1 Tax=Microbulbifer taiwanensis TaxID=986746 RepID=UPI00361C5D91
MNHNRQVAGNIASIKADVEASTTQADLVEVIRAVENHPGPLDYNDRPMRLLQWGLIALSAICLAIAFIEGFLYGSVESEVFYRVQQLIYFAFSFSSFWIPPLIAFFIALRLEERGLHLPLPAAPARIAAITVLGDCWRWCPCGTTFTGCC